MAHSTRSMSSETKAVVESKAVMETEETFSLPLTRRELEDQKQLLEEELLRKKQALMDAKVRMALLADGAINLEQEIKKLEQEIKEGEKYENELKDFLPRAETQKEIEDKRATSIGLGMPYIRGCLFEDEGKESKQTLTSRLNEIQEANARAKMVVENARNWPAYVSRLEAEAKAAEVEYLEKLKEIEAQLLIPSIKPINLRFNSDYEKPLRVQACVVDCGYGEVGFTILMPKKKHTTTEFFPVPFYYSSDGVLRAAFADDLEADGRYLIVSYNLTSIDIAPLVTIDARKYVTNFIQKAQDKAFGIDGTINPLNADGKRMRVEETHKEWGGECFTILNTYAGGPAISTGTAEEQNAGKIKIEIQFNNKEVAKPKPPVSELKLQVEVKSSLELDGLLEFRFRPSCIREHHKRKASWERELWYDPFRSMAESEIDPYEGVIARTGLRGESGMVLGVAAPGAVESASTTATFSCEARLFHCHRAEARSAKTRAQVDAKYPDDKPIMTVTAKIPWPR